MVGTSNKSDPGMAIDHTFQAWLGDGQPGLSVFQAAGSPQQRGAARCGFLEPRRAAGCGAVRATG